MVANPGGKLHTPSAAVTGTSTTKGSDLQGACVTTVLIRQEKKKNTKQNTKASSHGLQHSSTWGLPFTSGFLELRLWE